MFYAWDQPSVHCDLTGGLLDEDNVLGSHSCFYPTPKTEKITSDSFATELLSFITFSVYSPVTLTLPADNSLLTISP